MNGDLCAGSEDEIEAYFNDISLIMYYSENYLEYDDIENPIRSHTGAKSYVTADKI